MKWTIDKSFSFCYGHRVHNQRLNTKFTESGDACLACRHLHGHEGLVKVFLTSEDGATNVAETGMVTDFKHLGWFKNFLDDTLDHKFIMDIKDPLFDTEFKYCKDLKNTTYFDQGFWIPNYGLIQDAAEKEGYTGNELLAILEKYEGAIFVDFVPTSENLAAWLLKIAQDKMRELEGVEVVAVEYWETPKSHCRVEA